MGEIYHEWNGTILTITSDSGTSSMDLKGSKGDDGVRGPQGPAGDTAGSSLKLDDTLTQSGYAADAKAAGDAINVVSEEVAAVNERIDNLSIDAPVDSVNGKTGEVVLSAEDVGALPDTTIIPSIEGLATETYVDNAVAAKQNKVYYSTSQPTGWANGDIWLKPLS